MYPDTREFSCDSMHSSNKGISGHVSDIDRSNPVPKGELCRLALEGDVESIRNFQKIFGTSTLKSEFCSRDYQQQTPLVIALKRGDKQVISNFLALGAADSVFVKGSRPDSILCTLPFCRRPPSSSHSSDVGARLAASIASELPPPDILYLLDESLERFVNEFARRPPKHQVHSDALPSTKPNTGPYPASPLPPTPAPSAPSVPKAQPQADGFQVGDRVRLRLGKAGSSVAGLKVGKDGCTLYCARTFSKAIVPNSNGVCGPEGGPQCPSCRACSSLGVKELKAASDACLGSFKDAREGIVKAVRACAVVGPATAAPARLYRVASVHSGHLCYYDSDDLLYADGSLPGVDPVFPMADLPGSLGKAKVGVAVGSVPADWGGAEISKVEVSSDAAANGPTVLVDNNHATHWQSNGKQGSHFIQVTLRKPGPLLDFGIVIDENDGNYCPHRIRLFAGMSATALQDLGTQTTVDGIKGPKKVSLLKNTRGAVGVIKVVIEDSGGGSDCKVRGVTLALPERGGRLRAGDRVTLSGAYTGEGWNLAGGKVGVVVCAPEQGRGEQRGLVVSSLLQAEHFCFRSSWLEHAASAGQMRFRVGDLVQLDASLWRPGHAALGSRCLGSPEERRYGMVVGEGVVRDEFQRNVEVAAEVDGLVVRSAYPSFALHVASPFTLFPPEDRYSLITALDNLTAQAGVQARVESLVDRVGLDAWSRMWPLLVARLGRPVVMDALRAWQASRIRDLLTPALRDLLASLPDPEAAAAAAAACSGSGSVEKPLSTAADKASSDKGPGTDAAAAAAARSGGAGKGWACELCRFEDNPREKTSCQVCGTRGRGWTCECQTKNRPGDRRCSLCTRPRLGPKASETADEAAARAELREELERCLASLDPSQPGEDRAALLEETLGKLKGFSGQQLRTSVAEGRLKELGVKLGVRKCIMGRQAELTGPPRLQEICQLPDEAGTAVMLFPITLTRLSESATEDSLMAELAKHARVVSVELRRDSSQAVAYFASHSDAVRASTGTKHEARTSPPVAFLGEKPLQYGCSACTFLNALQDPKCNACDTSRPAWVAVVLAALDKATKTSQAPSNAQEGLVRIPSEPVWEAWAAAAERECKRAAEIVRDYNKQLRDAQAAGRAESDSEGSGEEGEAGAEGADEILENARLARPAAPASPVPAQAGPEEVDALTRETSHSFYSLPHYDPLEDPPQLLAWRDSWGSSAAHHAAAMRLPRALQALYDAGASRWAANRAGETPEALAHGLCALTPAKAGLHRAAVRGGFLRPPASPGESAAVTASAAARLARLAVDTPEDYRTPAVLAEVRAALLDGRAGEAVTLARELLGETPHARAYLAAAMLDEGFGPKAARLELDRYLAGLLAAAASGGPGPVVDPVLYWAHYNMWVTAGRPRGKKDRLAAAHALTALRVFREFAGDWLDETDDVDAQVRREGLDDDEAANPDDDEEADSEEDADRPGPDDPETQWALAKESQGMASVAMDQLMALTGLRAVKRSAMGMVKEVLLKRRRPAGIRADTSSNFLFVGNPGCGKTTVARLLGAAMAELGFRKNPTVHETSAQAILKVAPDPVAGFVALVKKAEGGTLFIDEAYRFSPNKAGGQPNASNGVLDYLLEAVERDEVRETTTVILAGYKDEIEALLAYNPGFASRFANDFHFEDFSEAQLRRILVSMVRARGLRFQSRRECGVPLARIVARRVARFAGKKGFGNARAVRNKVEEIVGNQTQRLGSLELLGRPVRPKDYKTLTREDAVGPRPDFSQSPMLRELGAMVGLAKVKEAVRKLVDLQVQNYDREMAGDRPEVISLHRVFHGNPGTGKTTVVRIYGALLKELGLLSKGDFIQCTPADLTGDAEGGAASNTRAMLERARGKVLFIDEAYVLDPTRKANQYGGNVLDTLVEKLEGDVGSDMAVILAGYSREMYDMLENNPGLRRRFNMDDFGVLFEDMNDAELRQVLIRMAGKAGLAFEDMEVVDFAVGLLAQKRRLPNFGNAGTAASLLSVAKVNKSARLADARRAQREAALRGGDGGGAATAGGLPHPDVLIKADFVVEELSAEKGRDAFSKLVNLEHIVRVLDELEAVIAAAQADGKDPADILADSHMVFTGPPGTGKTTVANKFGQLFKNLGLLPTDNVVVTTGTALQGQYVGETKGKVLRAMQQARGGILFIDECYGLDAAAGNWGYAAEAVEALVGHITEKEFKGNLLVIMSGYADRVNRMFERANPGFRSRFDKVRVDFPAWSADQATDAAVQAVERDGKTLTTEARDELRRCFGEMARLPSWASARDVFETVLPCMYSKRAARLLAEARLRAADAAASGAPPPPPSSGRRRKAAAEGTDQPYEARDVLAAFANALAAGGGLPLLNGLTDLRAAVEAARGARQLLVVDFFADWCGPCKRMTPALEAMRVDFPQVAFAKVDIDHNHEAAAAHRVETVPTLVFFHGGAEVHRVQGVSPDAARAFLSAFLAQHPADAAGTDLAGPPVPATGPATGRFTLAGQKGEEAAGEGPEANQADDASAGGAGAMSQARKKVRHRVRKPGGDEEEQDDEPAGPDAAAVWAALEEACKELGYTLDKMAEMLRPGGKLDPELIALVMRKTNCNDEGKIRSMLDSQRPQLLGSVEKLIKERDRAKTEEEKAVQKKLKVMGRCPMDFEWLRVTGGWRCAGGSHFMTDADLNQCNL